MDLHDFNGEKMYFDEAMPAEVSALIAQAAECYGDDESEIALLKAFYKASDCLTVIVALYRYYYYQHKYDEALIAASHALEVVSKRLEFSVSWDKVNIQLIGYGVMKSMTLVRFYLLCLKGAGYLNLRKGNLDQGIAMLEKVRELDSEDRLGVEALLQTVEGYQRRVAANFGKLTVVAAG